MSQSMGFAVTDIAYRNNPASIMEMLSGECDLNFATPSAVIEHVKARQAEDPGDVVAATHVRSCRTSRRSPSPAIRN